MAKTISLIKHNIDIERHGRDNYSLLQFDYLKSDGSLIFHKIYNNLTRKEAYSLKRAIMADNA